jgi:spermidine synthase
LHPSPHKALFLGLGTGVTARSAAADPSLQVDAVELLPEVIEASAQFTDAFEANNPRFRVLAADSRRFVRTSPEHYDVIVADNFHPARSGSGSLYTIEHFAAVRDRLAPGGLFCQWLPLHQMDLDTLRSVVRSFLHEYPHAWAMLATNSLDTPVIGLVARNGEGSFDITAVREHLDMAQTSLRAADFGLSDEFTLLGSFVAGPVSLSRFAAGAPLNTDDHPIVMYAAPRITYAPDSLPRDRLITLVGELGLEPGELLANASDGDWNHRLAAYWRARNRFLEVGRDVQPTTDVTHMLAQVREPLLDVLRISPEFRPAYDPLVRMAVELGRIDASEARSLLQELARVQPSRAEASQALRALP